MKKILFDGYLTDRVVYMLNIRVKCFCVNKLVCLYLFDRCLIGIRFLWNVKINLEQIFKLISPHTDVRTI